MGADKILQYVRLIDPLEEKRSRFFCCKRVQDECGVGFSAVAVVWSERFYI